MDDYDDEEEQKKRNSNRRNSQRKRKLTHNIELSKLRTLKKVTPDNVEDILDNDSRFKMTESMQGSTNNLKTKNSMSIQMIGTIKIQAKRMSKRLIGVYNY